MKGGVQRERQLIRFLESDGWWAMRAPASLGCVDVIALKRDMTPRMIEVKSNEGSPFKSFGPQKRKALLELADRAGADPILVHWPSRKQPDFIRAWRWPS